MMNRKRIPLLLLMLVLCMSLAACGSQTNDYDEDNDVIVGDDWRVTGVVRGSGTITRGDGDTYVLMTLSEKDAAFYYDTKEQVLFDSVEFPVTIPTDPTALFQGVDLADRNEDGDSDVALLFQDGENTILMVWFWDAGSDSYVFRPEESQIDAWEEG